MDPTSLLFFSCLAVGIASPKPDAHSHILDAYLRQSGIEQNLDKLGHHYEQKIPDEVKIYAGWAGYISKTVVDRKIVFTWRF
jgi:hypothetical protein